MDPCIQGSKAADGRRDARLRRAHPAAIVSADRDDAPGRRPPPQPGLVRQRAIAFIDRNLLSSELRPSSVADGIHVSRAVLYRAFQGDGGVATFLHERRLSRARLMLEERAGEAGIVGKVARAHGYASPVRFSRLFASHFAETPAHFVRKVRASRLQGGATGSRSSDAPTP